MSKRSKAVPFSGMNTAPTVKVVIGDRGPRLVAEGDGVDLRIDLAPDELHQLVTGAIAAGALTWPAPIFGDLSADLASIEAGLRAGADSRNP